MQPWDVVVDSRMLDAVVERAAHRRASLTVIEGPYGAGITTLALAAAERLRDLGITVLSAFASPELQGIPLGAMAPLFSTPDSARNATGTGTGTGTDEPTADRLHRLFLSLAPASAAPVLVVDDAQHLDDVSAAAVRQLVHSYGVRCIVTARSGEELPEPIARLDDEGLVHRTTILPLSSTTAAALVEHALGGRVEPESLQRLVVRTAGNPQLLRGLVRAASSSGAVESSPTGLVVGAVPLPGRLAAGLMTSYRDSASLDLAELIAVAGRIPATSLADRPALATLVDAGLTAIVNGGAVLTHPIHAETLVARMTSEQVDRLRITAAELISASDSDDDRFAAIVLRADSSSPPSTTEAVWAAQHANTVEDRAVAIGLADRAIELAHDRSEAPPHGALLVRADALSISGRLDDADAAFDEALAHATVDADLAATAVRAGFHYTVRRRQPDRAAAIWADVLGRLTDPSARTHLSTNIAKWQLMAGQTPLPDLAVTEDVAADAATALNPLLYRLPSAIFAGDLDTARASIAAGRPLAAAARHVTRHGTELLDFGEYLVILLEGRLDDALAFGDVVHPDRFDEAAGMWAYGTALAHYHAGRFDEALRLSTAAVEQLGWRDFLGALGAATGLRASAAAQLGEKALAAEIAGSLDADARRFPTAELQVAEAEAWLLAAAGDEQAALERIGNAVRTAADARYWCFAALTASIATRLGHPAAALEAMRAAADEPTAPIVDLLRAHAIALDANDPAGLLSAAEALETAGFTATAHDAARQAAALARDAGQLARSRRAATAVARIGSRLSPSPSTHGSESALSARELTIAHLAAGRHRNREIAEHLGLSLRTVENHLANVYRKLGVTGRDDLRDRLG